jgi:hypothetical protein
MRTMMMRSSTLACQTTQWRRRPPSLGTRRRDVAARHFMHVEMRAAAERLADA